MKQETKLATLHRRGSRAALLAVGLALLALALPTSAGAAKIFTQSFFPPPPGGGGVGNPFPHGVAVNDSSTPDAADGRIYVSDRNRVTAFDSDLDFEFSFGWDTIKPGAPGNLPNNEQQALTVDVAPSGTFTLSFGNATTPIPYNATAEEVEDALNALSSINAGGGSVSVSGTNPYTISFDGGSRADTNVTQITVNDSGLHAAVGQSLPCAPGATTAATVQYQWLSGGEPATGPGADAATYTTIAADAGKPLQCKVTVQGSGQLPSIGFSLVPRSVTPGPGSALPVPPSNLSVPTVVGSEGLLGAVGGPGGETITCNPGTWGGITDPLEYRWHRNGVPLVGNGADTATYTVQAADLATPPNFQCAIVGTNDAGSIIGVSEGLTVIPARGGLPSTPRPGSLQNPTAIGGFASTVTTTIEGASYEVCAEETDCKPGVAIGSGGAVSTDSTSDIIAPLAIDQSDGSLYLYDNNRRLQKFSADGDFLWAAGRNVDADGGPDPHLCLAGELCRAGATDSGPEPGLSNRGGIDVNPADGRIYAGDRAGNRVLVFEPDGAFAFMWGQDVGGGGQVETCASGCKAGASTTTLGGIGGNLRDIVIGDGGEVYLANSSSGGVPDRVQRVENPEADPTDASLFFTAPGALAIDRGPTDSADDDVIYAARNGFAGAEIAEVPAATGVVTEVHGQLESLQTTGNAGSLAHDPDHGLGGDRLLYSRAVNPPVPGFPVVIFEDTSVDPPTASMEEVTEFGSRSVTLEGLIDPNNNPTSYRFEYVDDATYQADGESFANALRAPVEADASAGNGDTAIEVSEEIFDLAPGTLYHARLRVRVTSGSNNGVVVATDPVSFSTDSAPPEASTAPVSAKATSALLAATVNPNGEETTYRFQYGTQGPCSENPCTSTSLESTGSVSGPKLVTHQLTGLQANTTYHYRLLVSSDLGQAATPDRTLVTIPQNRLPENRAWEKVSPDEKGNSEAGLQYPQAAVGGDALVYSARPNTGFPHDLGPTVQSPQLASRGPGGQWTTKPLAPAGTPHTFSGNVYEAIGYSGDLSKQLVWLANAIGVPGDGNGAYLRDNLTDTYAEIPGLGPLRSNPPGGGNRGFFWDSGMEHIAFQSLNDPITPETPLDDNTYLHGWSEGEDPELISKLPGGEIVPSFGVGYVDHRVSEDGSRVFWTPPLASAAILHLFSFDNGDTVTLSASERTTPDPNPPATRAIYQDATPGGELVFFTSEEKLTDDSTASNAGDSAELYRYDFSAPEGERLTDLTPAPGAPNGAEVQFVVDTSDGGERLYFVANARLAPGGIQGQPNLYLWEEDGGSPVTRHVATLLRGSLSPLDGDIVARNGRQLNRSPMATPDGNYLTFHSAAQLTASPTGGHGQVYLYDAPADRLECVSCPSTAQLATAEARLGVPMIGLLETQQLAQHQLRFLSPDGKRVFFQTAAPLLDADSNGKVDVYEWREGQLHLISSGQHGQDSTFVDADADGDNVFFATGERLVPTDTDSARDIYVARVDGVAPKATVPPPACEGESCSPLPVAPSDPTPASSTFKGPGNLKEENATKPRCGKNKRQVKRRGKVRCVKKKANRKRQAAKRKAAAKRRAKTNGRASR